MDFDPRLVYALDLGGRVQIVGKKKAKLEAAINKKVDKGRIERRYLIERQFLKSTDDSLWKTELRKKPGQPSGICDFNLKRDGERVHFKLIYGKKGHIKRILNEGLKKVRFGFVEGEFQIAATGHGCSFRMVENSAIVIRAA